MDRPVVATVGAVGRAHGIRGWVRVRSDMEPAEELLRHETWLLERGGAWRPFAVHAARPQGRVLITHFAGIEDRDAAAALAGSRVGLARDVFPDPGDGRYYWADLIGLEVHDETGTPFGVVRKMIETGANDVMVVGPPAPPERRQAGGERMIPFVTGDVVREVDLAAGRIRVSWPF